MKKLLSFLVMMVGVNAFAIMPVSLLYECQGEGKSRLIFSEGNSEGEAHIIYAEAGRDNFYLVGSKVKIRKEKDKISVNGQLAGHPRFASFAAEFPYSGVLGQNVKASLNFIDRYFMPLFNPPFVCMVKSVQSQR